ncbi:MAG: DUF11 domain-containing protein [Deltaproteobacteria bacterium]|nr:DUF11 domain-containing protein [Deltaproteobacteria bacterium]
MTAALLALALPARASVGGTPPAQLAAWQVQGSANTAGASMMVSDGFGVNIALLPDSNAFLAAVPGDAVVAGAWLFWSGSADPFFGTDNEVRLLTPGGGNYLNLRTDRCEPGETPCDLSQNRCLSVRTPTIDMDFYYCRRNITGLLARIPRGQLGGTYTMGDMQASVGLTEGAPGQCSPGDPNCQAKYGGWSIVVAWQSASSVVVRDAVLFDGFLYADEDYGSPGGGSGISSAFTMTGINARPNARAELSMFALEGDRQLGVPPQDQPGNPLFCTTCLDFLEISTPSHAARWRVTDGTGLNPSGNLFNSSNKGGGDSVGVDVDSFNVGVGGVEAVINGGDTSLTFVMGSGDGRVGGDNGGGELFFLGYLFVALDTDSPRLANAGTFKTASLVTASPGDVIAYTIRVTNDGAANATNVRVTDALPAGTTYVAGSTTNTCGAPSGDVGGTSRLFQPGGVNLGTIGIASPGNFCEVRFQVRINTTFTGTVRNVASISADDVLPFPVEASTTVTAPVLARFEKTVSGATGGGVVPGATLTYTLTLFGNASQNVNGASVVDVLPAELQGVAVTSRPAGSTLISDVTTGRLQVDGINVPAGGTAVIVFTASVRAGTADGTAVRNQGSVTFPGGGPMRSDDPSTAVAADPTTVTVRNRIDLTTSQKTVVSPASLVASPGTAIRWRIRAINSGNRSATVAIADDLPANVGTCTIMAAPAGVTCQPGGVNGTGRVVGTVTLAAGATADVEFTATVLASAPDGATLVNRATLTPQEDVTRVVTVTAPAVTVRNRPDVTTSTKAVLDVNGAPTRPGETVRYTVTVTNNGTRAATGVVVTDAISANLAIVTVGQGGIATGNNVTWNVGNLAVGQTVTRTVDCRVNAGVANGTVIGNRARIASPDLAAPFDTPLVNFTVTAAPVIAVTKTVTDVNGAPARPGDTVRYTLTLTNTGDGNATNVAVTDPVDASLTFVSATAGGALSAGNVRWTVATLGRGAASAVTLTFDARIRTPLDNGTVVSNQASVTSTEITTAVRSDDPGLPGATDPTRFTVTSAPAVAMTKTVTDLNGGDTLPGEEVRYTLTLTNTGDAIARNVTVTDAVDARLTSLVAETGGTVAGQTVTFTGGGLTALAPGTPVTLTFRARVVFPLANGTVIPNQARAAVGAVTVLSNDPSTPAALDPTNLLVRSRPALTVTKRVSNLTTPGSVYRPGNRIAYDLTVRNTGTENALNVVITDVLSANLVNIDAGVNGTLTGQTVRYDRTTLAALASVAPNTSQTVRIQATIRLPLDNGITISNVATGTADTLTPVPSDNPDTPAVGDPTVITITSAAVLSATKTVTDLNGGAFAPGDSVRYTITVRSTGTANARNVVISDPVDGRLRNPVPSNGGVVGGGGIRWDAAVVPALAVLSPTQSVTVTFTATVQTPLDDGTLIANQARITADTLAALLSDDPNTPVAADPTTIRITSAADLSVSTKEILNASGTRITQATPGQDLQYRIRVQNRGNATARNVVVDDVLPAQWTTPVVVSGTLAGSTATWTGATVSGLVAVAPGQQVDLVVRGRLALPLDDGTVVGNQAQLFVNNRTGAPFTSDDPATAAPGDQTRFTVRSAPLISVSKTFTDVNGGDVEPGDQVTYTVSIRNSGTANARNVVVTDPLAGALQFVSAGQGGTLTGSTVTWNSAGFPALAAIAPSAAAVTVTLTARVRTTTASGTLVSNQASVAATGVAAVLSDDPALPGPRDPTVFRVVAQPHLVVTKALPAGAPRIASPGDSITYQFSITNTGSATATGVTLRDELPFGVAFTSATGGGTFDALTRTVRWALPDVTPFGGEARVTLVVVVDDTATDGLTLRNQGFGNAQGTVATASDDPATPAALDPTVVTVSAIVDLSTAAKTVTDENGGLLVPGDVLAWRITVRNTGNTAARNVTVTDELDPALEVVEVQGGGTASGNTVTWASGGVPAFARLRPADGEVALVVRARVRATVADNTSVANQGVVRSNEFPAGIRTDNPATTTVDDPTVVTVRAPRLTVTKRVVDQNGDPTIPGDRIRYSITVQNVGGAPAAAVEVDDDLPAELVEIAVGQGGTLTGRHAHWDRTTTPALTSVAAAVAVELTVDARVEPGVAGNAVLSNQASVRYPGLPAALLSDDPSTPAGADPTVLRLRGAPSFAGSTITIDGNPPVVKPLDPIRFTITLVNGGTAVTQGAVLRVTPDPSLVSPVAEDGGIPVGGVLTWDASTRPELVRMLPGQFIVVHFNARVASPLPDGITISQAAFARSVEVADTRIGPVTVAVSSRPRFVASTLVVTDANSGEVEPGDLLSYRLTVHNDGSATGRAVSVVLPVPSGTRYVPGSTRVGAGAPADVGDVGALAVGAALGDVAAGASVVATFDVRVARETPRGYRVSAQAAITDEVAGTVASDDPRTPAILGDPTDVVVGGGAFLAATLMADPNPTGADGATTLRLVVENPGSLPAADVLATVPLTPSLVVEAGSLTVGGLPVSDADDGDAGGANAQRFYVRMPLVESGQAVVATLRVHLAGGQDRAELQGTLSRPAAMDVPTDGDPARAGAQPTVVVRPGTAADLGGSAVTMVDVNGGSLLAGDMVLVTYTLANRGGVAARLSDGTGFNASLDSRLQLDDTSVAPAAQFVAADGGSRVTSAPGAPGQTIEPGASLTITFRARVRTPTESGREIRTQALVTLQDGTQFTVGPASLRVGGAVGTSSLRGVVFEDVGGNNRRLDPGVDKLVAGYTVALVPAEAGPRGTAVLSAVSDDDGKYALASVAPGEYRVRVLSRGGAQFAERGLVLSAGEQRTENLRIDPSGVIYDSRDGHPLAGVRVTLFRDDGDDSDVNDAVLPADQLPAGQQDQVTGPDGRYRFDPLAGRYRLGLDGPQPTSVWPSAVIPVSNEDHVANPLGSFARTDADGNVVPDAQPRLDREVRYYLRFDLTTGREVLHNHVPVDPLASVVRLTKQANKRVVNAGDLVTYTVRLTNTAAQDFTVRSQMGGVEFADAIPSGFSYVKGSARVDRIVRDDRGQPRRERLPTVDPAGSKVLVFGAYDLLGRSEMELRYQLAVGPSARFGQAENRVLARAAAGQMAISAEARAFVEVRPETLFDDGTVVGKVFCDQDGDGWQGAAEEGVLGARVVLDTGFYAETDEDGRFHFTLVTPGSHLAKLDLDTLPPGAVPTTPIRNPFYTTRGLPTRMSWGVRCLRDPATRPFVVLNTDSYPLPWQKPVPPGPPPPDQVHVHGVLTQRLVFLDGVRQEPVRVDLGIAFGNQDPVIGQGPGPNLMAFQADKGLGMPLTLHPRVSTLLPLTGWRLVVEDEESHAVAWALEQEEPPPEVLNWDGRDPATGELRLQAGRRYIATLAVVATNGDVGISAPRRFGIRVGAAQEGGGYEALIDEGAGALFDKKGRPDPRLLAWLREEAPKLGASAETKVEVEVHGDDKTTAKEAKANQKRAERVRDELATMGVAKDQVEARGFGGEAARVPNMGRPQRAMNRRVVIRSRSVQALGEPLAPVESLPRVNLNGLEIALDEERVRFETDLPMRVGELVRVDLTMASGQRVILARTYTGQPFPEGASAPPQSAGVTVRGDMAGPQVVVEDTAIPVPAAGSVAAEVDAPDGGAAPYMLDDNGLPDREIAIRLRAPPDALRWSLRVFTDAPPPSPAADGGVPDGGAPDGGDAGSLSADAGTEGPRVFSGDEVVVWEQRVEGAPPEVFRWSGQNETGANMLRPGTLRFRFMAEVPGGVTLYAPEGEIAVQAKPAPVVLSNPFTKTKKLTLAAQMALGGMLEQFGRLGGTIVVTAHTDSSSTRMKALFETQDQADRIKEALVKMGVPESAVAAQGKGFQEPLVPGKSRRAREQNRRVELLVVPAAPVSAPAVVVPAVEVNGQPVPLTGTVFSARTFQTRRGDLVIAWRAVTGDRVVLRHHAVLPDSGAAPRTLAQALGPIPGTTLLPLPAGYVLPSAPPMLDGGTQDGGTDDFASWSPTPALTTYWAPGGFALAPPVPEALPVPTVPIALPPPVRALPTPGETMAAQLVVDLPPDGARLGTSRLLVRGMTHPLNRVLVNGQAAVVDPVTGQFVAVVGLAEGPATLKVEAEDVRGNRGIITRAYTVDTTGLFFMAFTDTAASAGGRLDEFGQYNSVSPMLSPRGASLRGGPLTFYGRTALYARGKWKGFWRIPFIEATLHLDSNRINDPFQERDLAGQWVSYYPSFGDNGVEVQEARARYPLYVRVKAGANELYVGNTAAALQNGDLFRYARARYTAMGSVDQGWVQLPTLPVLGQVDLGHTRARVFAAGGDTPRRPAHVELRGTGGSIYFLKDRYVVEGSERVHVVVRDAITGQEILRVLKVRNQDYTIRYQEGRVFLSMPLMSTADSTFITNQNPTAITQGNPAYLVVDYEHMGQGDFSEFGAGGAVEQVLLDHVAVGGGYVLEGRRNANPSYQLGGLHARAFWDNDNFVQAEWAYSRAVNVENAISSDGGLTYQALGQPVNAAPVVQDNTLYMPERQGHAYKLKGQVALGRWLGKAPTDVSARAYFQRVQPGFFSDGTMFDQGQWKYGAEGSWQITRRDSLRLRWDGTWTDVPLVSQVLQYRRLHREMATLQLRHVEGPVTFTGEYASNVMEDGADFGRVNWQQLRRRWMNVVAGQVDFKVADTMVLYGRQEGVLTADPQLMPRWNDRLTTTVGTRIKLLENLELNVAESLRWNGENATQVGLRTRVDDHTDLYGSERFTFRNGDFLSTTVVGAGSNADATTRTYGEYQLDTGTRMQQSRAVMGVSHQWTLMEGFSVSLGYERTHVLGTSTTESPNGPPTAAPNGTPTPYAFGDSYAFASPGAVGAQPMILGSGSRDALNGQVNLSPFKWLKFQGRLEIRMDNADERRGGFDRLVVFSANTLSWNWTEDLSFIGRFNLLDVKNLTLNLKEAELQELAAGLAYRPIHHEWLSVLALLRHRLELRPIMLTEGRFERTSADVASLEPIIELPFGLQLVEKVAFKWSREKVEDLKEGNAFMALWINRVNYHAFRMLKRFVPWFNKWPGDIDVAVEYRLRALLTQSQLDHGFVTEIGIVPLPFVRIGLGFNFSRVSDDEFAKVNQNAFGPYVRMQAQY